MLPALDCNPLLCRLDGTLLLAQVDCIAGPLHVIESCARRQFFLNVAPNSNLDWFSPGPSKHPVFGKIASGMDIAIKISQVPTQDDNPTTPIKMNSITIIDDKKALRKHYKTKEAAGGGVELRA